MMRDYYDAEEIDDELLEVEVGIFALSLNSNGLKSPGYTNYKMFPTQHIKLFLPFFIEEIRPRDVREHRRRFGLSGNDARNFEEALKIDNSDIRCQSIFAFLANALDDVNVAGEFAEWFVSHGKNENMIDLSHLQYMDKEAFAVYEYHILGIGNEKAHNDNVDRIAGLLFLDEIIRYLIDVSKDPSYIAIGKEIEEIWNQKTQFARWRARNLFIIRLMHAQSNKKVPKFWFNEFLLACDLHPRTRPIAIYLEPDYKTINMKYGAHLKAMNIPTKIHLEFADESYCPSKPRLQSEFGQRPDTVDGLISSSYTLRGYQEELAKNAKNGQNTIICAPTGSGKTIVALDIILNHLRQKRQCNQTARVVLFVPTIPLVEQQYRTIYSHIRTEFYVTKMSGAEKATSSQGDQAIVVMAGDVCVMTPQIFVNMVLTPLNKQKIYIEDFTLMVFDECHHCAQQHPYNVVMSNVRKSSIKPQIVGLTASVGTGKAKGVNQIDPNECLRHIIGLCARLDASTISSVRKEENLQELRQVVADPIDEFISVPPSIEDEFAHNLALFMDSIQKKMKRVLEDLSSEEPLILKKMNLPLEERSMIRNGSSKTGSYFSNGLMVLRDLVERKIIKNEKDRILVLNMMKLIQKCYLSLKMNELFPARLALEYLERELNDFEQFELSRSNGLSNRLNSVIQDMKRAIKELETLVDKSENKEILNKLFKLIKDQYRNSQNSRIIIFVTLRKTAPQLRDYIGNHPDVVSTFGRKKVGYITSSNQTFSNFGQSKEEQTKTLERFREGQINILIATSVAEEGIDVADCNLVIKYNSVGNETSFIQRKGRARDMDSRSVLLALDYDTKQREYMNLMKTYQMNQCINILQLMPESELKKKILNEQREMEEEERQNVEKAKLIARQLKTIYQLVCTSCGTDICSSSELKFLNDNHVIVCSPGCWKNTFVKSRMSSKLRKAFEYDIGTFCGDWYCGCGRIRGEVMKYGDVFLPAILKDGFRLMDRDRIPKEMNQKITWKRITEQYFTISSIEPSDIRDMASSLDDYEDIYRSAVEIELENLNIMAKPVIRSPRPDLEDM